MEIIEETELHPVLSAVISRLTDPSCLEIGMKYSDELIGICSHVQSITQDRLQFEQKYQELPNWLPCCGQVAVDYSKFDLVVVDNEDRSGREYVADALDAGVKVLMLIGGSLLKAPGYKTLTLGNGEEVVTIVSGIDELLKLKVRGYKKARGA